MTAKATSVPAGVSAPILAEALFACSVGKVEQYSRYIGKSPAKVLMYAQLALRLSKDCCFFCNSEAPVVVKNRNAVVWAKLVVCPCIAEVRSELASVLDLPVVVAVEATTPVVAEVAAVEATTPVVASASVKPPIPGLRAVPISYVPNYEEHHPWNNLEAFRKKFAAGEIPLEQPVYSNTCVAIVPGRGVCGARFTIVARIIWVSLKNNGDYKQQRKCRKCSGKEIDRTVQASGVVLNGARPDRKANAPRPTRENTPLKVPIADLNRRQATPSEATMHSVASSSKVE